MPAKSEVEKLEAEIATLKARIHDLETTLGLEADHLGVYFELPKSLASLLGVLMARPNVTNDMVQQRLELATDTKVAMHRLRVQLTPFHERLGIAKGEEIIQSRRGLGYWIAPELKAKINSLVTPTVTDPTIVQSSPDEDALDQELAALDATLPDASRVAA